MKVLVFVAVAGTGGSRLQPSMDGFTLSTAPHKKVPMSYSAKLANPGSGSILFVWSTPELPSLDGMGGDGGGRKVNEINPLP